MTTNTTSSTAAPASAPDRFADLAINAAALVLGVVGGGTSHRGWLQALTSQNVAGSAVAGRPERADRARS